MVSREDVEFNADQVRRLTLVQYEPFWFENLTKNLPLIHKGENAEDLLRPANNRKPTLVVGAGPSVWKHNQLQILADHPHRDRINVVATDRMLMPLMMQGIEPDYIVTLDGNKVVKNFFVGSPGSSWLHTHMDIPVITSVLSHPETVRVIHRRFKRRNVHWYVPAWDEYLDREKISYTRVVHWMTKKAIMQTFGNVGGTSWYFATLLLGPSTGLIGIDYGYPANTPLTEDQYYEAYLNLVRMENEARRKYLPAVIERWEKEMTRMGEWRQLYHARRQYFDAFFRLFPDAKVKYLPKDLGSKPEFAEAKIEDCYRIVTNEDTGAKILVGLNWDVYRELLLQMAPTCPVPTYNLSPESSLYGPGIKTMALKEWLNAA